MFRQYTFYVKSAKKGLHRFFTEWNETGWTTFTYQGGESHPYEYVVTTIQAIVVTCIGCVLFIIGCIIQWAPKLILPPDLIFDSYGKSTNWNITFDANNLTTFFGIGTATSLNGGFILIGVALMTVMASSRVLIHLCNHYNETADVLKSTTIFLTAGYSVTMLLLIASVISFNGQHGVEFSKYLNRAYFSIENRSRRVDILDALHQYFKCCGLHNSSNFATMHTHKRTEDDHSAVPESCCIFQNHKKLDTLCPRSVYPNNSYASIGCGTVISKMINGRFTYVILIFLPGSVIPWLTTLTASAVICRWLEQILLQCTFATTQADSDGNSSQTSK